MTGTEAIEILVLGQYSINDIERVFDELIAEGEMPSGSATDTVKEILMRLPFCNGGDWKGLPTPEDQPNLEKK